MTSDDWKTVLLALIAMIGTVAAAMVAIYGQMLLRRTDEAKNAAATAKNVAAETRTMINGRMDQLLVIERDKAFAAGRAEGIATVSKVVADSPHVSLEGHDIAKAIIAAETKKS